ncbi:hypothetical protein EYB39_06185 [Pantoea agglomerans]|nr:hypothetical protein EYB39_06185 [Pantoea agglomerans]
MAHTRPITTRHPTCVRRAVRPQENPQRNYNNQYQNQPQAQPVSQNMAPTCSPLSMASQPGYTNLPVCLGNVN